MRRLAVIGDPISHSLSPAMQEAAIRAAGLVNDFRYEAVRVRHEELPAFIESFRKGDFFGANVTIPHKRAVIPFLDSISADSRESGSVNTLCHSDGMIAGETTDGIGCVEALREAGISATGKKVAILGAGGAAQSVAFALKRENPSRLLILNRTPGRASSLALRLGEKAEAGPLPSSVRDMDIIINCTPLGMKGPHEGHSPLREIDLPGTGAVMDCVYNPPSTPLLRLARIRGLLAIDGTGMLIHQGARSFLLWTGKMASISAMRDALRSVLR